MRTIMVVNAKGGCGKSTLTTNLASYFAAEAGKQVALADFDPQQSSLAWLKARDESRPAIHGINASEGGAVRAPASTDVLILDTPARVAGRELGGLVRRSETLLVPVLPSPMDMRAAADFISQLLLNGRIERKETRIAVVANRVRENTLVYHKLESFLTSLKIPFIATLRDTQNYVRAAERGIGIFELAPSLAWPDVEQWEPLIRWLKGRGSRPVS